MVIAMSGQVIVGANLLSHANEVLRHTHSPMRRALFHMEHCNLGTLFHMEHVPQDLDAGVGR